MSTALDPYLLPKRKSWPHIQAHLFPRPAMEGKLGKDASPGWVPRHWEIAHVWDRAEWEGRPQWQLVSQAETHGTRNWDDSRGDSGRDRGRMG